MCVCVYIYIYTHTHIIYTQITCSVVILPGKYVESVCLFLPDAYSSPLRSHYH